MKSAPISTLAPHNRQGSARYRIAVDTGGTFTDLVVADEAGALTIGKSPSTPERPFDGVLGALEVAAGELDRSVEAVLANTAVFIYSTTHATNAILEGTTARTALLTTEGFPDILVLRGGGKLHGFDLRVPYPEPYVPRRLTLEIPERIDSEGRVVRALDEARTRAILGDLSRRHGVEAIAVCLLWSIANDAHEQRVGELIEEELPGVPYTLSHQLNPVVREYHRASAAAIDASLKPLMVNHLANVGSGLRDAGLRGELMVATSLGGVMHLDEVATRPVDTVRSGPSMAPVAGRTYSQAEQELRDVIVCDTGGTSFDVSLIRDGAISYTRETWLGPQFTGHLTGTSTVDIRSIGSGGGSIAWVDPGGLLRVGPQSSGADPGPACYRRGGDSPTVTDAAVVLGYIDPAGFLGGRMELDAEAAHRVLRTLGAQLGLSTEAAAEAVLTVANEHMVRAIQDITVTEGIDPREALMVAGGGAAGIGVVPIVRELGSRDALVPRTAGALSATGAEMSDLIAEFAVSHFADTYRFDRGAVNAALERLDQLAADFSARLSERGVTEIEVDYFVDARYAFQVWQLEVPLPAARFWGASELSALGEAFDRAHERVFSVAEAGARVECLTWKARLRAPLGQAAVEAAVNASWPRQDNGGATPRALGTAHFAGVSHTTPRFTGPSLKVGWAAEGPLIIEEPTSTLVIPPGARVRVTELNNYYLEV
jgi:N-methylhydantoinase A